jgi:cytidylate kinase
MARKVTEIVEKQIGVWSRQSRPGVVPIRVDGKKLFPVITISREFGSPGAALAYYLGEKIGFDVWDNELLKAIAEELGSDQKFIETLDERRQQAIEDTVAGYLSNVHTNVNYFHSLIRVVRTIEEHGSGIIVGRGANYICENPDSLHIRLVAPLKHRITYYANRMNISKDEVKRLTEQKDRERGEFIRTNFNKDVSNPLGYDLVINSARYSLESIAEIVMNAYEIKTEKKLDVLVQQA